MRPAVEAAARHTHIAYWSVSATSRLSAWERQLIEADDDVMVSVVAIREIAIKFAKPKKAGPNDMPITGHEARRRFVEAGFTILPVTADHAAAVDDLPPLHGDPFDRMLIAQATIEGMRLMTRDTRLKEWCWRGRVAASTAGHADPIALSGPSPRPTA